MKIEPIIFEDLFKQNLSSPAFACVIIGIGITMIIVGIMQFFQIYKDGNSIISYIIAVIALSFVSILSLLIPIIVAYYDANSTTQNYDEHITGTITTKIADASYKNNDNQFTFKSQGHTFKVWNVKANVKKGDKIKVHFDENVEKPKKSKPYDLDGDHLKYEVIKP